MTRILTKVRERFRKIGLLSERNPFEPLNPIQKLFCEWNALRLGISAEETLRAYRRSWEAAGGHGSIEFRSFCLRSFDIFGVFFDDRDARHIYEAYSHHALLHFLRMLSKKMHTWEHTHPVIRGLAEWEDITILDFGCGLAQSSWALARHLLDNGKRVKLVLADFPTLRKSFLLWMGDRTGVPVEFLDCTPDTAYPALPPCNVCIALDVFEHLHEPQRILRGLDAALLPGGFLVTDVKDHRPEYMHVSPDLSPLRHELEILGYEEIHPSVLFLKGPKRHGEAMRS